MRLNGSNFTDGNQNDPSPTNNMNHGNSCAGVIAATQNNNEGIAGICPNCQIMPIRIFNSNPNIGLTPAQLADAINFARNNGADIISNSWGFNSDNPNFQPVIVTAIQNATTQGRVVNGTARGCVVVFSAGNNALQNGFVHFPSNVNVSGVLTVGASDRTDLKSFYSPLGNPASSNNQVLDVTAPSHRAWPNQIAGETFEAWTIDIPGNAGYNPWPQFTTPGAPPSTVPPAIGEQLPNAGVNFQAYTGRFGGTSHSCPVVAGVAALVLSVNPNLTQQQVFNIITNNADQVGGYVYTNGRSNELGFGRVNACQSVLAAFETITSVTGPSLICSSGEIFTLNNAPTGVPISWQVVPSNLFTTSSGTGTTANLQIINPNGTGGSCVITYTIASGCGNITVQKFFDVGKPMVPTISPPGPFYKEPGQSVQVVVPDVSDQIEWGFTGNASNYTYTISQDGLQCTFTPNVPGNYQIKARATYGCEYSEYSVADVICEYNRPDLTIQNLNVSTSFNSITFNYDLVNLGNVTANSPLVNYYWSNNTTYEPGTDPLIGGSTTANIPPSGSVFVSKTFKVSSSQNYVLVYADPYDNILESNENNNLFWRPGFVPEFTDPAPETFSAYPIPFTEELTVNFVSSNNESNETEISSITQKEIYLVDYQTATVVFRKRTQNKSLTIDARKIPAGQYVLLVRGEITESMLVIKK